MSIMKPFLTFVLFLVCVQVNAQEWTLDDVEVYRSFDDFEHHLSTNNDTTYVINFWATWCGPCVKELPYFEALHDEYKDEKFKLVLVSLDFEKDIDRRFLPFLNKRAIKSEVVLLLDPNESKWIDRVDESWSGAIPITVVYNKDQSKFYEKNFHSIDELKDIIDPLMN